MESELTRSTGLVRNLLDFARQSAPTLVETDLNDIVNRVLDLAAHSAQMNKIEVVKDLDTSLPKLTADPNQLQQVFTNLVVNAIQAMPEGGKLTLRTSHEKGQLKLEVQDTGYGISPENMRKLFTPFFSTKKEVKGVGLGLAISYGIIQRHRGKIDVRSTEGKGTTFTVQLPVQQEKGGSNDGQEAEGPTSRG
jgi:two-component system NtrC family sensor kinase